MLKGIKTHRLSPSPASGGDHKISPSPASGGVHKITPSPASGRGLGWGQSSTISSPSSANERDQKISTSSACEEAFSSPSPASEEGHKLSPSPASGEGHQVSPSPASGGGPGWGQSSTISSPSLACGGESEPATDPVPSTGQALNRGWGPKTP
jgi:hypothetical protein